MLGHLPRLAGDRRNFRVRASRLKQKHYRRFAQAMEDKLLVVKLLERFALQFVAPG